MLPTLTTKRLALRPICETDRDRIIALIGDYHVARNLARVPHPYSRRDAENWIARATADRSTETGHFILDDGTGLIGAVTISGHDKPPMLGFWLGKPYWGQRVMTEAVGKVVEWYFSDTRWPQLNSGYFEDNIASWRIQKRLGFEIAKRGRFTSLARGRKSPHVWTRLTRDRFEEVCP